MYHSALKTILAARSYPSSLFVRRSLDQQLSDGKQQPQPHTLQHKKDDYIHTELVKSSLILTEPLIKQLVIETRPVEGVGVHDETRKRQAEQQQQQQKEKQHPHQSPPPSISPIVLQLPRSTRSTTALNYGSTLVALPNNWSDIRRKPYKRVERDETGEEQLHKKLKKRKVTHSKKKDQQHKPKNLSHSRNRHRCKVITQLRYSPRLLKSEEDTESEIFSKRVTRAALASSDEAPSSSSSSDNSDTQDTLSFNRPRLFTSHPLVIYRDPVDPTRGYCVRSTTPLPRNTLVCEYAGELLVAKEAKQRELFYSKQIPSPGCYMFYFRALGHLYCVDATQVGHDDSLRRRKFGFARYINHSRNNANLYGRVVITEQQPPSQKTKTTRSNKDKPKEKPQPVIMVPHLCFYAKYDIPANTELLIDYGDRCKETLKSFPWLKE